MTRQILLCTALLAVLAQPATSQQIVLGTGFTDHSGKGAEDGAVLSLEYIHSPFYEKGRFSARLAGTVEIVDTGDTFIGVGVSGLWDLQEKWFIEASVMPGAYSEGMTLNDLGSTFEIRSQLAIGKRFNNGKALSLALGHKSNASTGRFNPGVNAVMLRWHIPLH
jgi:lipid A 3-O-deacylase